MPNSSLILRFLIPFFLFSITNGFSQNKLNVAAKLDSLMAILKTPAHDSVKVFVLNAVAKVKMINNPDTAIIMFTSAQKMAEKNINMHPPKNKTRIFFLNRLLFSLNYLAQIYFKKEETNISISYAQKQLKVAEELENEKLIVSTLNNLALTYKTQGQIKEALMYFEKSLKLAEAKGNKVGIATALGNLGLIYFGQEQYAEALEIQERSLKINKELKSIDGMAHNFGSIAAIYGSTGQLDKATEYNNQKLIYAKELKNLQMENEVYNNLGFNYIKQNKLTDAYNSLQQGLKLAEQRDNRGSIAYALSGLADVCTRMDSLDQALKYSSRCFSIAKELGFPSNIMDISKISKDIYKRLNRPAEALEMHELYVRMWDSISGEETKKSSLKTKLKYEFEKKEVLAKAEFDKQQALHLADIERKSLLIDKSKKEYLLLEKEHELKELSLNQSQLELKQKQFETENHLKELEILNKDKIIKEAEAKQKEDALQKQKLISYSFGIGGLLILGLLFIAIKGFLQKRKDNQLIIQQKEIVEKQKQLVEEHQKEILDSINYAKRIQFALLASDNLLKNNLPEYFVLFKPKDVVSGDFYWATPAPDGFTYITADCTGHGVPGAFMSLLNISKLSQIINENKITRPDLILNNVRSEIIHALNPEGSVDESKDGMDAVICKLDRKNMKLQYAAANKSFYIIRSENDNLKLINCKADKMPVGKSHDDSVLFTYHEVELKAGDTIYTFTDGYADQFGGPKGKKFKYKQLEEILLSINHEPLKRQSEILHQKFEQWKGNLEQVDDVCIIGVRV